MSATIGRGTAPSPRPDDPRVLRTRSAVAAAARTLFLEQGYAGTTMEEIAAAAGVTRRTLYNNYADKETLFIGIVAEVGSYADAFALGVRQALGSGVTPATLHGALDGLGRRLALGIVRPEVIAIRRLLIGEARTFPDLAKTYYVRAPGQVITELAASFRRLDRAGLLRVPDARRAAGQFAYLVAGELLDRGVLMGTLPPRARIVAGAREGVKTFLARYGAR